ncbi:MAG: ABC transporter ATP-binding protein [Phycisphaerae bacterium]
MSDPLLRIQNLRVQFGRFLAVDDLSFTLYAGQLLGMIGPNGAGKTTTLRAAAGLQAPSTGSIHVLGFDVTQHRTEVGYHLGFAPDSPQAYDALTVEQFLRFIGYCYKLPGPLLSERIDHWLEALWLNEKRAAKVGALSRGMRQRLTVARTLLPDPHVVLLDEPAAGLDPAGRIQFRQLLASLRDQGKAVIVSSHILADLAEYCTHIAIMERGRVKSYGTVAQVAGAGGADRCHYRVRLAQSVGDAATRLAAIPNTVVVQVDSDQLTLEAGAERSDAAALLAALIHAGLPVAEFHAQRPDLEQAYLRSGIGQVD